MDERFKFLMMLRAWQMNFEKDGILWMHFTDEVDHDLFHKALVEEYIMPHRTLRYMADGSWMDFFPPRAYFISFKGLAILNHPYEWIHEGKVHDV